MQEDNMQEDILQQKVQTSTEHPFLSKVVFILMIIIGCYLVYTGIHENLENKYFNENGIKVQGHLTRVVTFADEGYCGCYEYVADGATYQTYSDTCYDSEEEIAEYSHFWYHPEDPEKVRFSELETTGNIAEIIGGAFLY